MAERSKHEPRKALLYNRIVRGLVFDLVKLPISSIVADGKFAGIDLPQIAQKPAIFLLESQYTSNNTSKGYNPKGDSDVEGQEQLSKLVPPN